MYTYISSVVSKHNSVELSPHTPNFNKQKFWHLFYNSFGPVHHSNSLTYFFFQQCTSYSTLNQSMQLILFETTRENFGMFQFHFNNSHSTF